MAIKEELKSKFIIRNYTDLEDIDVFIAVLTIIKEGRISNYGKQGKGYCFATKFNDGITVICDRFNKRDTFFVYKE